MERALVIAQQIAWPLAIIAILGCGIAYWISRQIAKEREELRTLRVAVEHAPSQAQVQRCLGMWPDLAKYPSTVQLGEMVKRATLEEGKRAQRKETMLAYSRFFASLAFLGVAIIVVGMFWKPT